MHSKYLSHILLVLTSLLLGIWAVKSTIFLRNSLLICGAILTGYYFYKLSPRLHFKKIEAFSIFPFISILLLFLWILYHFLFITKNPSEAYSELSGTWLRAVLGAIIGLGAGVASRKDGCNNIIWYGILVSFIYLIIEYAILAFQIKDIHAFNYLGYHYLGKINAVLMGIVLMIGASNTFITSIGQPRVKNIALKHLTFWLFSCLIIFYSYSYIFDTRSGVFIGTLFLIISIGIALSKVFFLYPDKSKKLILFLLLIAGLICIILVAIHMRHNTGWKTLVGDFFVSIQIYEYPNWRDTKSMGYPVRQDGAIVQANTYDRVSWATAGIIEYLPRNPYGVGYTKNVFTELVQMDSPNGQTYIPSSHSAWVDLCLAYGYIGILLFLAPLFFMLYRAFSNKCPERFRYYSGSMVFAVLIIYAVGELGHKHGLEILLFLISFIATLQVNIKHLNSD